MRKKPVFAVAAMLLAVCFAVGGTLAWLMDETSPVVNTFTYGDINITLAETPELDLKMVPGNTIAKDPVATVKGGSEACWLFVKVEESTNFDDFMTYAIAEGWTLLEAASPGGAVDTAGQDSYVIWRQVASSAEDQAFSVLAGDCVTVKETVTKEMLNALTSDTTAGTSDTRPKLTLTAYAVQSDHVGTAAEAWAIASGTAESTETT